MDMSLVIEQVSSIVIALEPPPQLDHFTLASPLTYEPLVEYEKQDLAAGSHKLESYIEWPTNNKTKLDEQGNDIFFVKIITNE